MATIASGRPAAAQDRQPEPAPSVPSAHPFSCNACQVAFRNSDLQKSHMKSDWHRYNLKRRLTSLRPISSELFAEKVLQSRANAAAEAGRATYERTCEACQKTYSSENSFQNHIASQKHKARAAVAASRGAAKGRAAADDASTVISSTFSLGEPSRKAQPAGGAIVDSDAEEEFSHVVESLKKATIASPVRRPDNPLVSAAAAQLKDDHPMASESGESGEEAAASSTAATPTPTPSKAAAEPAHSITACLFCNHASPTVPLNVVHMERFHGMFIPEKEYLVDLEGLLAFLEQRVRDIHECIYCGKIRKDVYAVQTHMRDKSHCTIPFMTEEEQVFIGDFYDFRGTYSDSEDSEDGEDGEDAEGDEKKAARKSSSGARLGSKRATKTADSDSGEDDGWETDNSESSLDSNDLTAVPADNRISQYERLEKNPHHSQTDPRPHRQLDGWHSRAHKHSRAVFYDEYELHLPSGRSVGHRAHNRYYRQNLRNYPSEEERAVARLALEAARDADAMDVDGANGSSSSPSSALTRGSQRGSRAVSNRPAPRNTLGLAGVSDRTKSAITKTERRAELAKTVAEDKGRIKFSANSIGQSFRFLGR